jgi:hypothetical protein
MSGLAVKGGRRKYFMENRALDGLGAGEAGSRLFPEV